jgi:hypothetical protein
MPLNAIHRTVIHRHSGWFIPLGFGLTVLLLCGLFLLWYLRPGQRESALTGDITPVNLSVHELKLAVPANHIETASARAGGAQSMLTLFALLPDMRGYSRADAQRFTGNAPDSPVIHLVLRGDPNSMDASTRLRRIYLPDAVTTAGRPGPFGLIRYEFRPGSVHSGDDLFTGDTDSGPVLLLCERALPDLPSPNCLATANPPARNLSLSYRFKRAYLPNWHQIAEDVDRLMKQFRRD